MRTHAGIAARMFEVLAQEGINIQMISTSEIKISVVVDAKYAELAVRVAARRLHHARLMRREIQLYDTTLRDGAQAEDVSFTLDDKLRIAEALDDLGIHYIEGGWPGSNPRDDEFFRAVARLRLAARARRRLRRHAARRRAAPPTTATSRRCCAPRRRWSPSSARRGTCTCATTCGSRWRRTST